MTASDAQQTFTDAVQRHRGILFKVANAYCRDAASREDLVQEILARLWRAYPRFDARRRFSTWAYRVAVNVAISFHRSETLKLQRVARADDSALEGMAAAPEADPDERMALLRELVDELDGLDRALMVLYLDDLPYSEIADVLGISQTNVATKIGRLKQRFKLAVAARGGA